MQLFSISELHTFTFVMADNPAWLKPNQQARIGEKRHKSYKNADIHIKYDIFRIFSLTKSQWM